MVILLREKKFTAECAENAETKSMSTRQQESTDVYSTGLVSLLIPVASKPSKSVAAKRH
jgi:hypothetical protein